MNMCCVTGEREKNFKEKKNEQALPSDSADGVCQQGATVCEGR